MCYPKTQKIPVINFSDEAIKPGSSSWESTAKDVCKALEENSCFLAVFDQVPSRHPYLESLKELFDLPYERKIANRKLAYYGYMVDQPQSPLLETFGITDGTNITEVSNFTTRIWPEGNDHYRDLMHSYVSQVAELDKTVTRMLFENYGVETSLEDHLKSTIFNVRMNKYRAPKPDERTDVGMIAHNDLCFMGINQQNDAKGLEVRFKDGSWVPVEFPPNSYVILAGDGMMAWSNGKIRHCLHRVRMTGEERYSTGLFSYHTGTVQIPKVFINENNPRKFKDFEHLQLLEFRYANPDFPEDERISAFCGTN